MKLQLVIGSTVLIVNGEDAAHAIALAERAEVYTSDWNGKLSKNEDQTKKFQFLQESELLPVPAPIEKLTKDLADSSSRWYKEYTEHNDTKKKLKELEEKLQAIKEV